MYSWNTTIDDSSSILNYTPFSDGASLSGGWMPWYSGYPGNFIKKPGDDSSGQSFHYTSLPGASVVLKFEGTAIYVYGSANCSYLVTLDSTPYTGSLNQTSDGVLFALEGLDRGTHFVNLTALPEENSDQQLGFDQAVITNVIDETVNGLAAVQIDNSNKTVLQYSGTWNSLYDAQIPSTADPANYSLTSEPLASVSMNFSGAIAVAINANRNYGHWTYNVSLDGVSTGYNASTYWLVGDTTLFYQSDLDPNTTHQIEFLNTGNEDYYQMTLNYMTIWMPNGTDFAATPVSSSATLIATTNGAPASATASISASSSADSSHTHSKVNVGAIVGPIVAVVAVLIAGLGFLLRRRRRRATAASLEVTPNSDMVAPFPHNTRPGLWYKGMEADPNPPQPVTIVVPVSGKRAQNRTPPPPPPPISIATDSSADNTTVSQGIPQNALTPPSTAPPSTVPPSSATTPRSPQTQVMDVNQIIELIAQRIDPGVRHSAGTGDAAPPYYDLP